MEEQQLKEGTKNDNSILCQMRNNNAEVDLASLVLQDEGSKTKSPNYVPNEGALSTKNGKSPSKSSSIGDVVLVMPQGKLSLEMRKSTVRFDKIKIGKLVMVNPDFEAWDVNESTEKAKDLAGRVLRSLLKMK